MIFPCFCASCNVILDLSDVIDIVFFYAKTIFMLQKTKGKETQ